jgi:hypothetical protein
MHFLLAENGLVYVLTCQFAETHQAFLKGGQKRRFHRPQRTLQRRMDQSKQDVMIEPGAAGIRLLLTNS